MASEILLKCRFSDSGRGFGFAEILDGKWDSVPEVNFYMKGSIDTVEKA